MLEDFIVLLVLAASIMSAVLAVRVWVYDFDSWIDRVGVNAVVGVNCLVLSMMIYATVLAIA